MLAHQNLQMGNACIDTGVQKPNQSSFVSSDVSKYCPQIQDDVGTMEGKMVLSFPSPKIYLQQQGTQ